MGIGNTQMEQKLLLGFLSISAINRYSFLCLEVKMGRLLCHQPAREQFLPHQSASQSVPETMAAAASHRELYNAGPHFLAYKATLSSSCQDRLLPAVASQLWAAFHCFSLCCRVNLELSSSCFLWLAGSSHTHTLGYSGHIQHHRVVCDEVAQSPASVVCKTACCLEM